MFHSIRVRRLLIFFIMTMSVLFTTLFSVGNFTVQAADNSPKIHVLSLAYPTDCILLESNGHFAMIDFGEDKDNITPNSGTEKYPYRSGIVQSAGFDTEVLNYLKSKGVTKLDWVLATHAHSDHIGLADTVINNFKVNRLYTKKYKEKDIAEARKWDNQKVYDQMIKASGDKGVPVTYLDSIGKDEMSVTLGDFKVIFMNCTYRNEKNRDENINSVVALVKAKGQNAYLAADIEKGEKDYTLTYAKRAIALSGKSRIDLYKAAHHGIVTNNSKQVLDVLNAKKIIVTRALDASSFTSTWGWNSADTKIFTSKGGQKANVAYFSTEGITVKQEGKPSTASSTTKTTVKKGWETTNNKSYYYVNNKAVTGWKKINGKKYYFNSKGVLLKGWQKISGKRYFLNRSTGALHTGWINDKGNKYFADSKGVICTGWKKIKNKWYLFKDKDSGKMLTGWQKVSGKWYYMNEKGVMQTGWIKLKGYWYYLKPSGEMVTGTQRIGGKTYWFYSTGAWAG